MRLPKVVGTDSLTVYKTGSTCAIGFQCLGITDINDVVNMIGSNWFGSKQTSLNKCGVTNVDLGFFNELKTFARQSWWNSELIPLLSGSECSGGLIVVGYSLGASLSDMFAGCTNNAAGNYIDMPGVGRVNFPTRPVTSLYTYAGVPVSSTQTRNSKDPDGIFPGHRFYVETATGVDPTTDTLCTVMRLGPLANAPWCGNKHLKQDAVRIYDPATMMESISPTRRRRARQIFTPADSPSSATAPAKAGILDVTSLLLHLDYQLRGLFDSIYAPR